MFRYIVNLSQWISRYAEHAINALSIPTIKSQHCRLPEEKLEILEFKVEKYDPVHELHEISKLSAGLAAGDLKWF